MWEPQHLTALSPPWPITGIALLFNYTSLCTTFLIFLLYVLYILILNVLQVVNSLAKADKVLKPEWKEMFRDVYYDMPAQLA
jgi:hypothetical protein